MAELQRLHDRFGDPHEEKFYNLLKRSELENVDGDTRKLLEDVLHKCKPCQTSAQVPRRFKFSLKDDKEFNQTVFVDILYIDKKPILHVVDESARYQAAQWIPNVSAISVWCAMRLCWIDVYVAPPTLLPMTLANNLLQVYFRQTLNSCV